MSQDLYQKKYNKKERGNKIKEEIKKIKNEWMSGRIGNQKEKSSLQKVENGLLNKIKQDKQNNRKRTLRLHLRNNRVIGHGTKYNIKTTLEYQRPLVRIVIRNHL